MKKLISLLAALGLGATGASSVISCGDDTTQSTTVKPELSVTLDDKSFDSGFVNYLETNNNDIVSDIVSSLSLGDSIRDNNALKVSSLVIDAKNDSTFTTEGKATADKDITSTTQILTLGQTEGTFYVLLSAKENVKSVWTESNDTTTYTLAKNSDYYSIKVTVNAAS